MPASQADRDHAVTRAGRIFAMLKHAADMGEECPPNSLLAERGGYQSAGAVNRALNLLVVSGMIDVEATKAGRIITICASGKKTAPRVILRQQKRAA